jgi:hypothetical protein
MKIENLVAVSGLTGLYKLVANRSNGLIIEDLKTGKHKFAPSRLHQFTPLESTGIFTNDGDSVPLSKVFQSMLDQKEDNPPVELTATNTETHDYFEDILPNYDKDQVKTSDIRKAIKWFNILKEMDLLTAEPEEKAENKDVQE